MPNSGSYFDRLTIGQYIGTVLFVALLETRFVARPVAFLIGPFVMCFCLLIATPSDFLKRWKRSLAIATAASLIGYAVTQHLVH